LLQNYTTTSLSNPTIDPNPISFNPASANPASISAYSTNGSTVSTVPSGTSSLNGSSGQSQTPGTVPSAAVASDFRIRITPLNPAFYGGSSPATSANGVSTNSGGSGTTSTGQLPTTSPGASNLLSILQSTNGVMFPYTPQITFEQSVDYTQTDMIQTNLTYEVYRKTPSVNITIQGKFTVQNQYEGQYAMAVIHFFRVASKMYFGTLAGANAGLPPPILVLSGYGTYMFGASPQTGLKCVLKSHSFTYGEQMDTVNVKVPGGTARLPAMFDLTVSLTVQQTPQQMRSAFNLDAFRTGALMQQGGWI
jgi:hypothetical protein